MLLTIILSVFIVHLSSNTLAKDCNLSCSSVFDPVCGLVLSDKGVFLVKYQNLCTLWLTRCKSSNIHEIKHVPSKLCGLKSKAILSNSRRGADFSIVGAHQVCNHSCPTYCVDTYDPVCGHIRQNIHWEEDGVMEHSVKSIKQTFVNHCHVDLFSCTTGLNVTITAMNQCYENTSVMLFLTQLAGLKSLGLLEKDIVRPQPRKS